MEISIKSTNAFIRNYYIFINYILRINFMQLRSSLFLSLSTEISIKSTNLYIYMIHLLIILYFKVNKILPIPLLTTFLSSISSYDSSYEDDYYQLAEISIISINLLIILFVLLLCN